MRFSLRRLNCRWLKPINGAGKIGRVRDLWYFSLSSLGLGLGLSGKTIFSGKIGLGRNLRYCWEKLVAPEIFDIFPSAVLVLVLTLAKKIGLLRNLWYSIKIGLGRNRWYFSLSSVRCLAVNNFIFTKGLNHYDWGGCTLSTSRGLVKHLEDWQIKWKHVCPFNWLQMRCLQAGGRGKRQLPRSQIGKVGDSPFYWTNILIFQSEHFKAKSLLFSANLGENSLIWKQFYRDIYRCQF